MNTLRTWYYTLTLKPAQYAQAKTLLREKSIEGFQLWDNPQKALCMYVTLDTQEKIEAILQSWFELKNISENSFGQGYDSENFWII